MNAVFLAMAAGAGMTSAILNPLHSEELGGIMAADVLLGNDRNCARWIRKFREPSADPEPGENRRAGRRRRRG